MNANHPAAKDRKQEGVDRLGFHHDFVAGIMMNTRSLRGSTMSIRVKGVMVWRRAIFRHTFEDNDVTRLAPRKMTLEQHQEIGFRERLEEKTRYQQDAGRAVRWITSRFSHRCQITCIFVALRRRL
ncbi:hypothetical protein PILCRDRAFT_256837 [Piloderma croceum F 1598]|uniref:Uncharacterized protein n=1 Tax=Piloderma croceum (strain F 1598) TaxID=765440 RepID=A0A0C3G9M6_PILCF|nr:hypothetical protein PILCRDRAFT_256837 [Piloderma croceum F 1598]